MDKRKVAREARKLAMECVTGEAPPLIPNLLHSAGRYCVAGLLSHRVCGSIYSVVDRFTHLPALGMLIEANNSASDEERHGAVVFPLLAFADDVEAMAPVPERA